MLFHQMINILRRNVKKDAERFREEAEAVKEILKRDAFFHF